MLIDNTLQATLLLCCYFNKNEVRDFKPLTPTEYGPFAKWLKENRFNPADLLQSKNEVLELWHDPKGKITSERIESLLSRGASMGFALEKWSKSGIWMISRADPAYPKALKNKLKEQSPPVLFGTGNKELLTGMGIGFVGSRSIDDSDEAFTEAKAQLAVKQGFTVVSGGAKGVDQVSMLSALKAGGYCIGVLADSLFRSSVSKVYREYLADQRLVLISPFYPEAGFNTGNAMARNKYIYSLSKAVVVVKSDLNKGGTWSGAIENLKKSLSASLIRNVNYPGNQELIKRGGNVIDDNFNNFNQELKVSGGSQQFELNTEKVEAEIQKDLFSLNNFQSSGVMQTNEVAPTKISRTYANKDEVDVSVNSTLEVSTDPQLANVDNNSAKNILVVADPAISTSAINTTPTEIDLTSNQVGDTVECLPLDEYGSLLKLFYQNILQLCQDKKQVSMDDLKNIYPELSAQGISKWLAILTEKELLIRVGKRHIYRLVQHPINI